MTIEQANQYFAALPDGFASTEQLRAAFTAPVQKVQFVGVAGTAGKTVTARLLAAILHAQGIHAGLYHAGCRPLSERICIDDAPVDEGLLALTADTLSAAEALPQDAAELAAAANCFCAAGCTLAVVELPDAGLAEALPGMPVCAVTSVGPDGVSRSVERLAALAAGVMRKESICVTAPEQPKSVLSELIVAAGKCGCELVVPDPEDITFLEAEKFASKVDYGGYTVPLAFLGRHAAGSAAMAVDYRRCHSGRSGCGGEPQQHPGHLAAPTHHSGCLPHPAAGSSLAACAQHGQGAPYERHHRSGRGGGSRSVLLRTGDRPDP